MGPLVACIDYETSSLDFYNPGFQIKSLAMSYIEDNNGTIKYWYSTDFLSIQGLLKRLADTQIPVIAHNIAFEYGVTRCMFPGIDINWHMDTARLTQLWDNGGLNDEEHFGLEACVGRVLPEKYWMHKEGAHEWIRQNITTEVVKTYKKKPSVVFNKPVKKGQEGKYISRLPLDILAEYNRADVEVTLRLYLELTRRFDSMGFDWTIDRDTWLPVVKHITDSKIRGVKVDLSGVNESLITFQQNLKQLVKDFRGQFPEQVAAIELQNKQPFNINSTKNLKELFVDQLGIQPKILTKKNKKGTGGGKPSFKKTHLGQWGDAAALLVDRGSLQQVIGASKGLIKLVEASDDKRWHCDLKTCGTRTGRYAGGGGLNIQGLSRRNQLFMQNFKADEGMILVSQDLVAGEPTATTHYSKDYNYKMATFDMVGKEPYYEDGILYCDDLYLMVASVSPFTSGLIKQLCSQAWPAGTFFQQWVTDVEVIKKKLKKERVLTKMLCLGLSYGMGARKLQQTAIEIGADVSLADCRKFHKTYWGLFHGVADFAKQCQDTVESQGYILNEFGYRSVCDPHKAFNALIQSTISGIINAYTKEFFGACKWSKFVTIIHDEVIYQVPKDKVKETREISDKVLEGLNKVLEWGILIRMGFAVGNNFYEAK